MRRMAAPTWAILEYGWYPLMVFVTTPYFLHVLGADGFGFWMLLTATVGFGSFLNIGTGAATIKQVAASYGRADVQNVETVVRASLTIALFGGGVLAIVIFAVYAVGGGRIFMKMGDPSLILLTGGTAALLSFIEQLDNVFASALKGAEQFGRAARIEISMKTSQLFAAVLAVFVWGDLVSLYAALLLFAVVRLAAKSRLTLVTLKISSLRPRLAGVRDILNFAKWGWVQGIGGLFFGTADRLLVGGFLGAASLTHYSVATQLAQQIHAFSAAGISVMFPKISRKMEGLANFALSSVTKLTIMSNFLVSSLIALGLLIFGEKILDLWLGGAEAEASTHILWYLTIGYWVLAFNVVPHFVLLGMGKIRLVALSNLVAGTVSILAMLALVQPYGLVGVGIARIAYGIVTLVTLAYLIGHLWMRR